MKFWTSNNIGQQPWIHSRKSDSIFILAPPFLALLLVLLFPKQFTNSPGLSPLFWLILVVFVDVAHVYSTLFRTYFNSENYRKNQSLYIAVPLTCYVTGVILYDIDGLLFWRTLAYLAVFHFIRQQYGFMSLYSRKEPRNTLNYLIDTLTIYSATLYPIIYWHLTPGRNFNWFIEGDFFQLSSTTLIKPLFYIYLALLLVYFIKESLELKKHKAMNIPKNLLICGTAVSWFFGIVFFNGDMAFTTLNVISHGIPYMALIWLSEKKHINQGIPKAKKFTKYKFVYFLLIIVFFAYLEEGLWDGLIWNEHNQLFSIFSNLPKLQNSQVLTLVVPLLSLPQSTHYVLDGFIWKRKIQPSIGNLRRIT